jgi:hypothetical protein
LTLTIQPQAQNVYDIASATSQLVNTAAPCGKSSISMVSRGLWLPLAFLFWTRDFFAALALSLLAPSLRNVIVIW